MSNEEPPEDVTKKELWNRLRRLEQAVFPSRRDVLKAGGAAGAAGLLGFGAGSASAADTSPDRVGASGNPVDVYLDELKDASGDLVADVDDTGPVDFNRPVSVERIDSERHYAGAYSGSDPDARLDNALSAASSGETIYLEATTYDIDRTISSALTLVGGSSHNITGTIINATWTFNGNYITLKNVFLGGTISVTSKRVSIYDVSSGSVTFESGTDKCIIDTSTAVSVTDNSGSNTIGDIA